MRSVDDKGNLCHVPDDISSSIVQVFLLESNLVLWPVLSLCQKYVSNTYPRNILTTPVVFFRSSSASIPNCESASKGQNHVLVIGVVLLVDLLPP